MSPGSVLASIQYRFVKLYSYVISAGFYRVQVSKGYWLVEKYWFPPRHLNRILELLQSDFKTIVILKN